MWHPAKATIRDEQIELTAENVKIPAYVRYAYAAKPEVNLVNAKGLPAYPFSTEVQKD